jgi:BON domain
MVRRKGRGRRPYRILAVSCAARPAARIRNSHASAAELVGESRSPGIGASRRRHWYGCCAQPIMGRGRPADRMGKGYRAMAKQGQHKNDHRDPRGSRGRNTPKKSTPVTTGMPKKRGTYERLAREHEDTAKLAESPPPLVANSGLDAGIEQVPLETNDLDVVDDSVYDAEDPVEPDPAYFPPTDPVIGTDRQGNVTVLGGFEPTSMSSVEVDPSAEDARPGDEALADAIRRELREDAATTDLDLEVQVERGVARLSGTVPSLEDAENAESVASRVPGIREVADETDVQGM